MAGILTLLPVRNGEAELPDWFESVRPFSDAVIALDDGSTDATAELLGAEDLVVEVLSNPARDGFAGWDDGANRRRLLEAAERHDPEWIVWIDVDERCDPEDGAALAEFLRTDAIPGCAYGLELHRMWGEGHTVAEFSWVFRIFAFSPGLQLGDRTLHFNPIPSSIPRAAWVKTTIRLRHLDSQQRHDERVEKYGEVDPEGAFDPPRSWLAGVPDEEELVEWSQRDPALAVLDPDRVGGRRLAVDAAGSDRATESRIACLLPVRNGEHHLPGWLESVSAFADLVVALDDGSIDATRQVLESSELIERVLTNPVRGGFEGWDDAANRQRLLDAAAEFEPDWVFWLDADERLDPGEAKALRRLCDGPARPGYAYLFRVFRMIGDEQHFDPEGLWVARLFAFEQGALLPCGKLHALPVPESIPRERFVKTTIRIKHLAGLDEALRRARFDKYREADPDREFQSDYSRLLREPGLVRRWNVRAEGQPLLVGPGTVNPDAELDLADPDEDAPILSAVVIAQDNAETIEESVRAVIDQEVPGGHETIVVVSGSPETAAVVREKAPEAQLIEIDEPVLPGAARNAGLAVARGDYVSFPGSHIVIAPGSLAERVAAHERGYPMVTGTVLNGTHTRAGWASYLLDHSRSLPNRPRGPLIGAPGHCSYARDFLVAIGGFPEDMRAGEDTVVNTELTRRGHRTLFEPNLVITHRSRCTTTRRLVRHHYGRGRAGGQIMRRSARGRFRLLRVAVRKFGPNYVRSRVQEIRNDLGRWAPPELLDESRRAMPLVWLGAMAAWTGIWRELLRIRSDDLGR